MKKVPLAKTWKLGTRVSVTVRETVFVPLHFAWICGMKFPMHLHGWGAPKRVEWGSGSRLSGAGALEDGAGDAVLGEQRRAQRHSARASHLQMDATSRM